MKLNTLNKWPIPMQHLQPNSTLQGGKYKIERVLGQGGFGITYLAEHRVLQREVAIKEFFMKPLCHILSNGTYKGKNKICFIL